MRIEGGLVCFSPEPGLVRVQHVRMALGHDLQDVIAVELVVVAGEVARQRIELVRKVSGRGQHVAFQCPRCLEPRAVLHAEGEGRLSCAICSGYKTRHQMESWRTEWDNHGHHLEDRLLRAVMRRKNTLAGMRVLRELVDEIVGGDHDRLASAMQTTSAALLVADAADH